MVENYVWNSSDFLGWYIVFVKNFWLGCFEFDKGLVLFFMMGYKVYCLF